MPLEVLFDPFGDKFQQLLDFDGQPLQGQIDVAGDAYVFVNMRDGSHCMAARSVIDAMVTGGTPAAVGATCEAPDVGNMSQISTDLFDDEVDRAEDRAEEASQIGKTSTETGSSLQWTRNMTLLLLDLYGRYKSDFLDPRKKKKKVWDTIAGVMMKEHGYGVNGDACDKKMRNMKITYKGIRDNRSKTGRGKKTWEFFDQMEELFGSDHAMSLPNILETGQVPDRPNLDRSGLFELDDPAGENRPETSTPRGNEENQIPGQARTKAIKRKGNNEVLANFLKEAKSAEEKRLSVLCEIKDAIVKTNADRLEVMKELNTNIKALLNKL